MSGQLTVSQFTEFLNNTFSNGLVCPLCHKQDWQVRAIEGVIDGIEEPEIITDKMVDAAINGEAIPPEPTAEPLPRKIAADTIAVRCGHCGNLVYFDRPFVMGKIHD